MVAREVLDDVIEVRAVGECIRDGRRSPGKCPARVVEVVGRRLSEQGRPPLALKTAAAAAAFAVDDRSEHGQVCAPFVCQVRRGQQGAVGSSRGAVGKEDAGDHADTVAEADAQLDGRRPSSSAAGAARTRVSA